MEQITNYETTLGRLHLIPPTIDTLDKENIPTRAISLMWNQRSVDVPLGLPFNIASYGLLLHILAEATNMIPDEEYFEREDLLELQEKKDTVELEKNLEIHEEPQVHIEPKRLSYSNRNGKSLRINRI